MKTTKFHILNTLIQNKLNIKLEIKFKNILANSEKVRTFAATYLPRFPSDQRAQGKFLLYKNMNKEERIDYWLSVAEYDLETAGVQTWIKEQLLDATKR